MSPEEHNARAARAYRAYQADVQSPDAKLWASMSVDEQRPWMAAVHAALAYKPESERKKSAQHSNIVLKILQLQTLINESAEAMNP